VLFTVASTVRANRRGKLVGARSKNPCFRLEGIKLGVANLSYQEPLERQSGPRSQAAGPTPLKRTLGSITLKRPAWAHRRDIIGWRGIVPAITVANKAARAGPDGGRGVETEVAKGYWGRG